MLLPILTALLGATVDLARLYEQRVKLEAATRSAAEWVASDTAVTTSAQAATEAQALICAQFNLGPTCTYPSVVVNTYTRSTSNPGTPDFPQVTISLTATQPFSTLFPWPYISTQWRDPYNHGGGPNGTATAYATALTASYKFVILQGR
jgi:Flp pilus assembly protein TadG